MQSYADPQARADVALPRMLWRVAMLVCVLAAEALIASVYLDGEMLVRRGGILSNFAAMWGAWAVRGIIGFAALFATFAYLQHRGTLLRIGSQVAESPPDLRLLTIHAFTIAIFAALSAALYGSGVARLPIDVLTAAWMITGVAAVASLAFAAAPYRVWADLVSSTGKLWLYAIAASATACIAGAMSWALWTPTTRLTYAMVKLILSPFVSDMLVQPERMRIGTSRFAVIISPECSGLEGAALLIVFAIVWMILFRHEVRFPRSLILIPAGVLVLFLLNTVRIAVLILIGNAGAREVAAGGFHSQAGWIAFNSVAFGLSIVARRLPWFSIHPIRETHASSVENPTAAYLIPFLAIIAAGMVSQAMSGGFEWFYSLRLLAALTALWWLRRSYTEIDWRFGWLGVTIGIVVFGLWIAMEPSVTRASPPAGMPAPLAGASTFVQVCWIAFRTIGAVVTVPVAEELAFRGFGMRRLISTHFETIPYRQFTALAVAVSSILFGLMHGDRWLAGTVAGALYAAAAIRSGRLGEAVIAHATTNALLAGYVLATGNWRLW